MNEVNALEFSMPRGRSWQDPHVILGSGYGIPSMYIVVIKE